MPIVLWRDSDGTPNILSPDLAQQVLYKVAYRRAREWAENCPLETLETFFKGYNEARMRRNFFARSLCNLFERLTPGPNILAYREVLKERREALAVGGKEVRRGE